MSTHAPSSSSRKARRAAARAAKPAESPEPIQGIDCTIPGAGSIPVCSAQFAGLRYVTDNEPGIRREGTAAAGFRYFHPTGKPVTDEETLKRIRALALPPAYTDVWICTREDGHLQATGRDARGRKQYRYHKKWREVRDENKYGRMIAFGQALPTMRDRVEADLALPGLPRDKVLATVVRLLERSLIRVGNEEYARSNQSYGLTTMKDHHVKVTGTKVQFRFRGKSGKTHSIDVQDRRIAGIVKRCRDLPGQELFQYLDDNGEVCCIGSEDVNRYLREVSGQDFTAKDFRTWAGTVLAAAELRRAGFAETKRDIKKKIVSAIQMVSSRLGNTPAVCRKCYIHPAVLDAYLEGTLESALARVPSEFPESSGSALNPMETAVMAMLAARAEEAPDLEKALEKSLAAVCAPARKRRGKPAQGKSSPKRPSSRRSATTSPGKK